MLGAGPLKIVDTIPGSSFLAIQAVMKAAARRHPDFARYNIKVLRDDVSVVVVFEENSEARHKQGDFGLREGAEKELSASELQLLLSKDGQGKLLGEIRGASIPIVDAATAVFRHHHPDLTKYKIAVFSEKDSMVVIFTDKLALPRTRGNPGALPGFEVELKASDLHVIRSNFIR